MLSIVIFIFIDDFNFRTWKFTNVVFTNYLPGRNFWFMVWFFYNGLSSHPRYGNCSDVKVDIFFHRVPFYQLTHPNFTYFILAIFSPKCQLCMTCVLKAMVLTVDINSKKAFFVSHSHRYVLDSVNKRKALIWDEKIHPVKMLHRVCIEQHLAHTFSLITTWSKRRRPFKSVSRQGYWGTTSRLAPLLFLCSLQAKNGFHIF